MYAHINMHVYGDVINVIFLVVGNELLEPCSDTERVCLRFISR